MRGATIPTENEIKIALRLDSEKTVAKAADNVKHIRQGYLAFSKGLSVRVRETNGERFEFCFKQRAGGRVVEIEKKIDQRDFEDLWNASCNKLEKIRYEFEFKDCLWEIDVFRDHNHHTYAIVAELEMPEGQIEPEFIPEIIADNLLYAVPGDDDRFASKKLANVRYAKKLYDSLIAEEILS